MKSPNISLYQDYRLFLNDYFLYKKKTHQQWSLGIWQRQLGLQSRSTLTMIIKGQRHPSLKLVTTLCNYFKFSERESTHFKKLVELQKRYKNSDKMTLILTKKTDSIVQGLQPKKVPSNEQELQDVLLNPLTHILRELTTVEGFKNDVDWIQKSLYLKVSSQEIAQHIQKLKDYNLLYTQDGTLKAGENNFQFSKPSKDKVFQFHSRILETTKEVLSQSNEDERSFNLSFVNIRKENFSIAKKMLREFQAEFNKLTEEKPGDCVYQLSIQFVPVTLSNPS